MRTARHPRFEVLESRHLLASDISAFLNAGIEEANLATQQFVSPEGENAIIESVSPGLWSDPATWGGQVPGATDDVIVKHDVVIDHGLVRQLEIATGTVTLAGAFHAYGSVIVRGTFLGEHGTLNFHVSDDRLFVGNTRPGPIAGLPDFHPQDIGLWVMPGGELDLRGQDVTSWSDVLPLGPALEIRNGITASIAIDAGRAVLSTVPVGWLPGDTLLLVNERGGHALADLVSVEGQEVRYQQRKATPSEPDFRGHILQVGTSDGISPKVANLSRRLQIVAADVVEGNTNHRAHVAILEGATANINNVELRNFGPRGKLGRYPIHWHHGGAVSGSLVGSSIWQDVSEAGNRFVALHEVQGVQVQDNVAFRSRGHGFFMEDGHEFDNSVIGNLSVAVDGGEELSNVNQNVSSKSHHFWLRAGNEIRGNVAAGGTALGLILLDSTHPGASVVVSGQQALGTAQYGMWSARPNVVFENPVAAYVEVAGFAVEPAWSVDSSGATLLNPLFILNGEVSSSYNAQVYLNNARGVGIEGGILAGKKGIHTHYHSDVHVSGTVIQVDTLWTPTYWEQVAILEDVTISAQTLFDPPYSARNYEPGIMSLVNCDCSFAGNSQQVLTAEYIGKFYADTFGLGGTEVSPGTVRLTSPAPKTGFIDVQFPDARSWSIRRQGVTITAPRLSISWWLKPSDWQAHPLHKRYGMGIAPGVYEIQLFNSNDQSLGVYFLNVLPETVTPLNSNSPTSPPLLTPPFLSPTSAIVSVRAGAWSDPITWGGRVPTAADDVIVQHDVIVDHGVVRHLEVVAGTLALAGDISAYGSVIIWGGLVGQQGTLSFHVADDRTFVGNTRPGPFAGLPDFHPQDIGLWVMPGGELDLHGQEVTSWSDVLPLGPALEIRNGIVASVAVDAGRAVLTAPPVGWLVGDTLLLVNERGEYALADLVSVQGQEVRYQQRKSSPSEPDFRGHILQVGTSAGISPKVANLSRRLQIVAADVVQGNANHRAHVAILDGATANISNIELRNLGPRGKLGRYPIYWRHGAAVTGSLVGSSIWQNVSEAGNRFVALDDVQGVQVRDNVAFRSRGHGFFMEEGKEFDNQMIGNLSVAVEGGEELSNVNQNISIKSHHFWLRAGNEIRDNVAAGGTGLGLILLDSTHPGASVVVSGQQALGTAQYGMWSARPNVVFENPVAAYVGVAGFAVEPAWSVNSNGATLLNPLFILNGEINNSANAQVYLSNARGVRIEGGILAGKKGLHTHYHSDVNVRGTVIQVDTFWTPTYWEQVAVLEDVTISAQTLFDRPYSARNYEPGIMNLVNCICRIAGITQNGLTIEYMGKFYADTFGLPGTEVSPGTIQLANPAPKTGFIDVQFPDARSWTIRRHGVTTTSPRLSLSWWIKPADWQSDDRHKRYGIGIVPGVYEIQLFNAQNQSLGVYWATVLPEAITPLNSSSPTSPLAVTTSAAINPLAAQVQTGPGSESKSDSSSSRGNEPRPVRQFHVGTAKVAIVSESPRRSFEPSSPNLLANLVDLVMGDVVEGSVLQHGE